MLVHHATFSVNSLAHWLGAQPFADDHTPRDHIFTAFISFGEGYHNFHHEFPYDYRNAIWWYQVRPFRLAYALLTRQYDPTKWLITLWYALGLAWDLKTFGTNEIQMGVWQMKQKKLREAKAKHQWGPTDAELPAMDWWEYQGRVHNGEKLIVIDKYVLKIAEWMSEHPGGPVINQFIGKVGVPSHFLLHLTLPGCHRRFQRRCARPL